MFRKLTIPALIFLSICTLSNCNNIYDGSKELTLEYIEIKEKNNKTEVIQNDFPEQNEEEKSDSLGTLILKILIGISSITFSVSLIMVIVHICDISESSNENKYKEIQNNTFNLSFSDETLQGKIIDVNIFETNYELMTTEVDEEERELSIRDF
jgi:hypothetical protein